MSERSYGPGDFLLVFDTLRKLAQEGVRVTIAYDEVNEGRGAFYVELRGGKLSEPLDIDCWDVSLMEAITSALDMFRRAWADDFPGPATPTPPTEPPIEFVSESGKVRESPMTLGEAAGAMDLYGRCIRAGCGKSQTPHGPYCLEHVHEANSRS